MEHAEALDELERMLRQLRDAFMQRPYCDELLDALLKSMIKIIDAFSENMQRMLIEDAVRRQLKMKEKRKLPGRRRSSTESVPGYIMQRFKALTGCPGLLEHVLILVLEDANYRLSFLAGQWRRSSGGKHYKVTETGWVYPQVGGDSKGVDICWAKAPIARVDWENFASMPRVLARGIESASRKNHRGYPEVPPSGTRVVLAWENGEMWETIGDREGTHHPLLPSLASHGPGSLPKQARDARRRMASRVLSTLDALNEGVKESANLALKRLMLTPTKWMDTGIIRKAFESVEVQSNSLLAQYEEWGLSSVYRNRLLEAMVEPVEAQLLSVKRGRVPPPRAQWTLRLAMNYIVQEWIKNKQRIRSRPHHIVDRIAAIHRFMKLTPAMRSNWISQLPPHFHAVLGDRREWSQWDETARVCTPPYLSIEVLRALGVVAPAE